MAEEFYQVLDSLRASESAEAVFAITDKYAKSIGFEVSILAVCGRLPIETNSLPPFLTSASEAWIARYKALNFYSVDPITNMVMRSNRPFTYAEVFVHETEQTQQYWREAAKHGLEFGWAVPIHKYGMPPGIASFAGREKVMLNSDAIMDLTIVSLLAYQRVSEFFVNNIPAVRLVLSDREREVLTHVARGKTNWEVGAVLSLSEYSIRDYLKTLSVKLETSNRTHTVARAMQLGLIVP